MDGSVLHIDLERKTAKIYAIRPIKITGLDRPRGFQEIKALIFRDNGTEWW